MTIARQFKTFFDSLDNAKKALLANILFQMGLALLDGGLAELDELLNQSGLTGEEKVQLHELLAKADILPVVVISSGGNKMMALRRKSGSWRPKASATPTRLPRPARTKLGQHLKNSPAK
jgi:hypothetical protein